jgi:hypothetical protein
MPLLRKFTGSIRTNFKKVGLAALSPYFFGRVGVTNANQQNQTRSVNIDGNNSFITAGNEATYPSGGGSPIGNQAATIFKIAAAKTTTFSKKYSQTSVDVQFEKSAVDSSGNIYAVGTQNASSVYRLLLTKVDSSGVLQWSRRLGDSAGLAFGYDVGVDSSGNVYVGGYSQNNTSTDKYALLLAKYNSSGTIQWQKKLYQSVGNNVTQAFSVDSSGNCYIGGYSTQAVGPPATTYGFIAKYNSSGTLQWQKQFLDGGFGNGSVGNIAGIKVNSSGDIFTIGSMYNGSTTTSTRFLQKLNSSGTVQWQRSYSDSGLYSVTLDSSSNLYICGEGTVGTYIGHILKYNSSGTIQWQRKIDATLSGQNFKYWWAIDVDANDNLGVAGLTGQGAGGINNNLGMIARYPNDGAFTGTVTVGGIAYTTAVATGTDASYSISLSTASLTSSDAGFTDESVTLTEATITTPVTLVNI